MPQIDTAAFGRLDYADDAVLDFPSGLPAFEDQTRFVLIERPDLAPLVFLQSLARPDLAFPALPVAAVAPDYQLEIADEDRTLLGLPGQETAADAGLLCLAIVTLSGQTPPTVNLMAPVVVNSALRRAVQVVQTTPRYSHQHPLFAREDAPPCS
jgi:flagellar assembly factor FliW